jgi:ATP-dependent RNA helicase SUPV3L1/SUV3
VIRYDRLVPLEVDETSLDGSYSAVRPGDCVIIFSRRRLFDVRRRITAATGLRCAAVYGNLPPGMILNMQSFYTV